MSAIMATMLNLTTFAHLNYDLVILGSGRHIDLKAKSKFLLLG